jgi:hypothetical protein
VRRDLALEVIGTLFRSRAANLSDLIGAKLVSACRHAQRSPGFQCDLLSGLTAGKSPKHTDYLVECAPEPKCIDNLCQVISQKCSVLLVLSPCSLHLVWSTTIAKPTAEAQNTQRTHREFSKFHLEVQQTAVWNVIPNECARKDFKIM